MVLLWGLFLIAPKTVKMNFVRSSGLKDAKNWPMSKLTGRLILQTRMTPSGQSQWGSATAAPNTRVSRPKSKVTFRKGMFGFVWNFSDWPRIMWKGRENVLAPALDFSDVSLRNDKSQLFFQPVSQNVFDDKVKHLWLTQALKSVTWSHMDLFLE